MYFLDDSAGKFRRNPKRRWKIVANNLVCSLAAGPDLYEGYFAKNQSVLRLKGNFSIGLLDLGIKFAKNKGNRQKDKIVLKGKKYISKTLWNIISNIHKLPG